MEEKRVVLGLSGGVDSAAAALLLRRMGYRVLGVFLQGPGADPAPARRAAAELDIPLEIVDIREELERKVICPFVESYLRGETPNPCILCNPAVKFRRLAEAADRLGAEKIATGHYAVARAGKLYASPSPKDQSYMLYRLPPDILARCVFPLGEVADKAETRAVAGRGGLSSSQTPDSMDSCFIPGGDHGDFIESRGLRPKTGNFVDEEGRVLGPHRGIHRYTVGQRRGLGIAAAGRLYVRRIDPESGDIVLSLEDPVASGAALGGICMTDPAYSDKEAIPCRVRVRHSRRFEEGVFLPRKGRVEFVRPVRALTPGQSAVCYGEDGQVLGGGFILRE